ncbi:MAG: RDD family protein [Bacteriovoracaceae bacterium]|nr:RDD family protein [Bacteriovoracaceae bacterium]
MEKQINQNLEQKFNPEIASEILKDLKDIGVEIESESDIHWNEDIFREKLTAPEVATLVRQQDYTDYINPLATDLSIFSAYIIDLVSICTLTFSAVSIILLSFKTSLPQLNAAIYSNSLAEIIIWTFALTYIGYFSFLESRPFSTIGKNTMGIRTTTQLGLPLSIAHSCVRTIVSILTLGRMQDELTNTKVIRA